ncbi:MAG: glutathione S-transferase family protein [Casimicrobiaceae bacterium]
MPQPGPERRFYAASGSPYVWRVWLALEHKRLPYTLKMMSFSDGDLRTPEFAALNPRRKVPVLDDAGFVMHESAAIVEYLEDAYRDAGEPLFPADVRARAIARRKLREADEYVAHAMEDLVDRVLFTPEAKWDAAAIVEARDRFVAEMDWFERELTGDFLVSGPGAADFTLYPIVALALRTESRKKPDLAIAAALGPRIGAWMRRIEALPYFEATYPPHWKIAR